MNIKEKTRPYDEANDNINCEEGNRYSQYLDLEPIDFEGDASEVYHDYGGYSGAHHNNESSYNYNIELNDELENKLHEALNKEDDSEKRYNENNTPFMQKVNKILSGNKDIRMRKRKPPPIPEGAILQTPKPSYHAPANDYAYNKEINDPLENRLDEILENNMQNSTTLSYNTIKQLHNTLVSDNESTDKNLDYDLLIKKLYNTFKLNYPEAINPEFTQIIQILEQSNYEPSIPELEEIVRLLDRIDETSSDNGSGYYDEVHSSDNEYK